MIIFSQKNILFETFMRNKAINQTLQKQELNYFSQGNSSQKKTLQTRFLKIYK